MRTLQEKYNGIQEGKFSKDQFLVEARQQLPTLITRYNGYDDTIQILKNRGMIVEAKVDTETLKDVLRGGKKIATGVRFLNAKDYKDGNKTGTLEKGDQVLDSKETVKEAFSKVWDKSKLTKTTYEDGKYHSSEKFKTVEDLLADKEKTDAIQKRREEKGKPKTDHILKEAKLTKKSLTDYRYKPTNDMDKYPYEQILRGLRVELEVLNVKDVPTAEEYTKALSKVAKNLEKDSIYYTNLVAGVNPKVDLHDKLIPINQKELFKTSVATPSKADGNKDTFNDLKKAQLKEGFKKLIKKILTEGMDNEEWRDNPSDPLHDYMKSKEPKEDEVENYKKEAGLEEASGTNDPKIQRLVDGINQLIAQAVDSDGDPIGVIEPGGTWDEPAMYSPIEYKNGALKITTKSPYKTDSSTETILAKNMEYDGIPTLRLIMRMYKKAVKKAGQEAYPQDKADLDETATNDNFSKWRELDQDEKDHISKFVKDTGDRDQAAYEKAREERLKAQSARLAKYISGEKVDEAMDNTQDLVTFSLDSEDLDQILHTNFGTNLAYQDDRGDSLYTLPQEDFDRFMDYITSLVGDQAEDQVNIHSGSDHWGNDVDDISHPRGYEEASDEESFEDLFESISLFELLDEGSSKHSTEWFKGYRAFNDNKKLSSNPYKENPQKEDWVAGWDKAQSEESDAYKGY